MSHTTIFYYRNRQQCTTKPHIRGVFVVCHREWVPYAPEISETLPIDYRLKTLASSESYHEVRYPKGARKSIR